MAILKIIVFVTLVAIVECGESNEIVKHGDRSRSWLTNTQDILAGPAGQMVVQVAKELINRSLGNSQVLSLNLSNLLILILLKVLILSVGFLGAGHWSHYARRRSYSGSVIEGGEPRLLVGFLAAQGSGDDSCLHKAACLAPATAKEYARAAQALLGGLEKFSGPLEKSLRYKDLIGVLQKAAYDGYKGAPCDLLYQCEI